MRAVLVTFGTLLAGALVLIAAPRLAAPARPAVAPSPPPPPVISPERILELKRANDVVEMRFADCIGEVAFSMSYGEDEYLATLDRYHRSRNLTSARVESRGRRAPGALRFDVSLQTDWQGLRGLLGAGLRSKKFEAGGPSGIRPPCR